MCKGPCACFYVILRCVFSLYCFDKDDKDKDRWNQLLQQKTQYLISKAVEVFRINYYNLFPWMNNKYFSQSGSRPYTLFWQEIIFNLLTICFTYNTKIDVSSDNNKTRTIREVIYKCRLNIFGTAVYNKYRNASFIKHSHQVIKTRFKGTLKLKFSYIIRMYLSVRNPY